MNFQEDLILENDRALLRPIAYSDFDDLWKVTEPNPQLLKYSPKLIASSEALKTYLEIAINARKEKTRYALVIYDKKVEALAGSTSMWLFSEKDQRLEIGHTWIGDDFQGTGLNRNCKFLLLSYAFETLGYLRVELKADALNVKSRRAIQKIGGKEEGILRSHMAMWHGGRRDTVYYSILAHEWKAVKAQNFGDLY